MATIQRDVDDITAIQGYAKQFEKKIILQILHGLTVVNDVNVIYDLSSTRVLPKYTANKGFRPEDTTIRQQNGKAGKFSTRSITPRVGMKILEIVPADFRNTYFSDQVKPNSKDLPFAEAFWNAQNLKLQTEVDDNHYFGQNTEEIPLYNAGTAYAVGKRIKYTDKNFYIAVAATTAGQSPDTNPEKWADANNSSVSKGFGTIIEEDYALFPASNKIVTGALTVEDAHDQFNEVYQGISQDHKKLGGVIYCSPNSKELYRQSTLDKFPSNQSLVDNRGNVSNFIFGSEDKWSIKPVSWMAGSGRLIATPDPTKYPNLYMGTNILSDFGSIGKFVDNLHGYDTIMKMSLAFQIADLEITYLNDQK
ncbi:hypothetical protein [Spirosoma litoris]